SGRKGLSQGGVLSPVLSNLYLNDVDRMLERAQDATRRGAYTYVEYARFADDLVILVDAYAQHDWLHKAVDRRLRRELAKLHVDVNEEKSRYVDLAKGESFGFLGFEFRRVRSLQGKWQPYYSPKLKQRTVLLRKLKEVFRRFDSQPVARVVQLINPILRGLGQLLCHWQRQSLLRSYPRLGGEEGATAFDAGPKSTGLRLEEVE